ncbi:MAG: sorbosone dehydrogenase family protein [Hyphomonadaceae bacterium]|nr:sorbosone dehydrogenase family protein [Hyphomonadaceae bacterium]
MARHALAIVCAGVCAGLMLAACSGGAPPEPPSYGANPVLPAPKAGGLPTIKVPKAVGWPEGAAPVAAAGLSVTRYGSGLDHPRWLYLLPNGDVLVAESSSQPSKGGGIERMVANAMMRQGGAFSDGGNRIVLLRDADADGIVDEQHAFIEGLKQPMGMALVGDALYVANTDALLRFPYTPGATSIAGPGAKVLDLPYRADSNGHWTRTLRATADGSRLFIAIGSVSNIGDEGMAIEEGRAAIWELTLATGAHRVFASGLRNPVGLDLEPATQTLWTAVNERDMIGDNTPPDYMTSVRDGGFYGWPWSYWGQNVDARVQPPNPEMVAKAIAPDYALGAHTASLGLHFYTGDALPAAYKGGAFVGQRGSWNRSVPSGYKVVFVPFANGAPAGDAQDVLTGFLNAKGEAQGRPVGVATDRTGALLVADDAGDMIWRVAAR